MRLAFVDLVFSWPPNGGADVDLYNTLQQLNAMGHEAHCFVTHLLESSERGRCEPDDLPFPATRLDFSWQAFNRHTVCQRVHEAVAAFQPDAVVVADGFFLKPDVLLALSEFPCATRFYAYEVAFNGKLEIYPGDDLERLSLLTAPQHVRKETLRAMRARIKHWNLTFWEHEYLAAQAYRRDYPARVQKALASVRTAIVSNDIMARLIAPAARSITIMPGGVNAARYPHGGREARAHEKQRVLMTGRVEDPAKGLAVLREAGTRLAARRADFLIQATISAAGLACDWFECLGWRPHEELVELYRQAAMVVVPSLWEEPFGLVAVEAMATGTPVIVSEVGGLKYIPEHGESGLLVHPGDADALAAAIEQLLDGPEARARMGANARRRVEETFDWPRVVEQYWPGILEQLE